MIQVKETIGTGDPFDQISLIPLISQWGVPRNCLVALRGEECAAPLARLYVLMEPVNGHTVLGVCEKHHQEFTGAAQGEGS